ncbi:MAG TPA: Uma2 family endonuclease [Tepidisphaeraceae bacterium]|jgi:Uma2 family endonuclease
MALVSTIKMTARQYLMLGEDPPGVRLELVDGQIAVHPGQTPEHSYVGIHLSSLLSEDVDRNGGELFLGLDVVLGEYDVRRPDLIYFRPERAHLIGAEEPVCDSPDLCVEIISSTSSRIDRTDKLVQYAEAAVPYYWIVDPKAQSFDAFENRRGAYRPVGNGTGSDVVRFPPFERLELALASLWFRRRVRTTRLKR